MSEGTISRPDGGDRPYDLPREPGFYEIPTLALKPCPWAVRLSATSSADEAELDHGVQQFGVLEPILAVWMDSVLVIVAGMRRWYSARRTGQPTVPVRILDVPLEDARAITIIENSARVQLRPWEEAVSLYPLLKVVPDISVDAVEQYTRWSRGKAHARLVIARGITPEVLRQAGASRSALNSLSLVELMDVADEPLATRPVLLRSLLSGDDPGHSVGLDDGENKTTRGGQGDGENIRRNASTRGQASAPIGERPRTRSGSATRVVNASCLRDLTATKGYVLLRVTGNKVDGSNRAAVLQHVTRLLDRLAPDVEGLADSVAKWLKAQGAEVAADSRPSS